VNAEAGVGAVLGIVGFIISALLSLVIALLAYINKQQQKEHEKAVKDLRDEHKAKLDALDKKTDGIDSRLHEDEKATIRIDGDLKLARNESQGLIDDIHDLKKGMVTKVEFETRMNNQDKLLGMVLQKIDGSRYSSQSAMGAVRPPESDPPRRPR
jgi:hypothetical protein